MTLKMGFGARKAVIIGSMCSVAYLAVYIARNILAAVSPQLTDGGVFSIEAIGTLSGVYFASYAIGQLINGAIGDKIKAKHMISLGLVLAGVCNGLFPMLVTNELTAYIAYGVSGFFLSMIYGPMTKLVSENTEPIYATRCSLGYTFASFFGSPIAGVLASMLPWQNVFTAGSAVLIVMGVVVMGVFSFLEKKGLIEYGKYTAKKGALSVDGIKTLVKHRIIKFTLISVVTGIIRTTVVSLMTLYFAQHLGFSSDDSAMLFTGSTLIISFTTFIAIFLYERLQKNMDLTILLAFGSSAIFFTAVFFVKNPFANVALIVLAIMSSNTAATMLWSRYCPSLRDTGMVSTATGFLDFMSYMAAALSSTLFTGWVSSIGWSNLILIWIGLMVAGVIVALPYDKFKNNKAV